MKNLLAIAVVMLFTAFAAQAQQGSNCSATATGTFTFTVEAAIGLTGGAQTFELGGICPGCNKEFTDKCATWTVTGGADCKFNASTSNTLGSLPAGISVISTWQYSDDTGPWEGLASGNFIGMTSHPDQAGGYFFVNNNAHYSNTANDPTKFRICVGNVAVDCNTTPAPYSFSYTLTVDYTCAL